MSWKKWNAQGLIPGADETEIAFIERVTFCQNLKQHLSQKVGTQLPFEMDDPAAQAMLNEVLPFTQELYGIQPQWVPLMFSNYQLAPWHGGCAWIFQLDEHSPTAAFLQLRARFRTSSTYLGFYSRHELIAHELAHVGRMLYQEPQFEEIWAYQSSSSFWRRQLGPIVQSSKESLFFILFLGGVILSDLALLSFPYEKTIHIAWGLKGVLFILIALALSRLLYRQHIFKKCLQNLKILYPQSSLASHLLYRLRDNEIKQFAHFTPAQIIHFMEDAEQSTFRWRFLKTLYPPMV